MTIAIVTLKTVVAYIIQMLIGVNLIGVIVRGFIRQRTVANTLAEGERITNPHGIAVTIFSIAACGFYLYALFHFWNLGIFISGFIIIISRLPDLLFEIKTGQKISDSVIPKNIIYTVFNLLNWAALPVLWYSIYILQKH